MKIGVAQIQSRPGDIAANIFRHIEFIQRASAEGADALFFPEMARQYSMPVVLANNVGPCEGFTA